MFLILNPVIKDELEVKNGRVEDNFLLLQFRLQFVLNLTGVDEQHLGNFFHLLSRNKKIFTYVHGHR